MFPPGFVNREGQPLPLIVQKSDGGYGYAASDLAALRDRFGRLEADLALYVVGAPQAQHFAMCFAVAAKPAGSRPAGEAVHVAFGSVLGADRKMFADPDRRVDQAGRPARRGRSPGGSRRGREEPGRCPPPSAPTWPAWSGIGAVKYADLSTDRIRDYVFDWDRMLAFEGNTAPYLQYAHVRCLSIFRRGEVDPAPYRSGRGAGRTRGAGGAGPGPGPAGVRAGVRLRRSRGGARTGCAAICSSWRGRSPPSSRPARCCRPATRPCATAGWCCARRRRRCWPGGWECWASRRQTACSEAGLPRP